MEQFLKVKTVGWQAEVWLKKPSTVTGNVWMELFQSISKQTSKSHDKHLSINS